MAFQMKSCNIVMVYHIYKHHIVLPPPSLVLWIRKQADAILWESRSSAWAEWAGSPGTGAFVFPFLMVTSPGTYTLGTSLLPKGPGMGSACVSGMVLLSAAEKSSCSENVFLGGWNCWGSPKWCWGGVMQPDVFITVQNNTKWNV